MKLPLSWLSEFVTVEAGVDEIARRLSVAGLEVENIERIAPSYSGVVIAKVLEAGKHPNADRLSLCRVDAGSAGTFSIVCGAPNVRTGMTGALALVGAKLAGAHKSGVEGAVTSLDDVPPLQAATIRGIRSEGMMCSERELALSSEHQGILELPPDAPIGTPLGEYLHAEDVVFDIAITANRGDCLSILGFAREISALFGVKLHVHAPRKVAVEHAEAPSGSGGSFSVEITAPDLCPRYAGLEMAGLKIGPSPIRVRRRLELCGMRALNNVVDVTNYVMLEIGQPLHAFDIEKLAGRKIIVRRAGEDRDFETLDGLRRELRPDDLVIADGERAVAIAGVMGGLNSEISDNSRSLLLESAYFEPITVARTARRLGLRSEAGYRFERGIDRAGQAIALMRAAELLSQNAGAHVKGAIADVEPRQAPKREISLDLKSMALLLGVEIQKAEVKRRLISLGAAVKPGVKNTFTVTPPPHRSDLNQPADLAEEVARLTGLDDIPATLPSRDFAYSALNQMREFFRATREVMLGAGLTETDTIAFVSSEENRRLPGLSGIPVRVENPLSEELGEMRLSLLPGLVAALRFNLNRQAAAFHAFEIAKTYVAREGGPAEPYRLGMVSYGDYAISEIGKPAIKAGFFTLKGVVETCLESLQLGGRVEFRPPRDIVGGFLHPGRSAQVAIGDEVIGYVGELHPRQAMEREFVEPCALAELDLEKLISYGFTPRTRVEPPPRFPAIRRDLALVLDREFPAAMVVKTILEIAPPLLEGAELFDVFEGGNLAPGKKSVALAIRYRAKDRTLTDEEVNRVHAGLVEQARTRLGAELRQ